MSKTIDEILAPKPEARPRIYAYSIADKAHAGLLKVGQTTRDVRQRVAEQLRTANIRNFKIELDEIAEGRDGAVVTDRQVRAALIKKGFQNTELEWMRCSAKDVRAVLLSLRAGQEIAGTRDLNFPMRTEQSAAVEKTHAYYHSIWKEDMHAVPRFLWNAKMRFGKTFSTYQLARKLGAKLARFRTAGVALRIGEVPISYRRRSMEEGKKIGWRDGVRAIYCIVKYGLGR
jgi:hypothetical protein